MLDCPYLLVLLTFAEQWPLIRHILLRCIAYHPGNRNLLLFREVLQGFVKLWRKRDRCTRLVRGLALLSPLHLPKHPCYPAFMHHITPSRCISQTTQVLPHCSSSAGSGKDELRGGMESRKTSLAVGRPLRFGLV